MFSPAARALVDRLGLEMGLSNITTFADALLSLAKLDPHILAVTGDSRGSGRLEHFAQALPRQIVEVGVAEQNLVGIAAGLAAAGKTVFAVSPACFLTARAIEQIKNDVCYSDVPVTLVGISAGVSYGALGSTHHSLHDLAVLRAIPNLTVFVPADNFESREALHAATRLRRPVYIRLGKARQFHLHGRGATFQAGRAIVLREGADVAFIATGETVVQCVLAAEKLKLEHGWNCRVISMPTVKPLDAQAVLAAGRECRAVLTVEEHSVHGGLGEACAAVLIQDGVTVRFRIVGIPDEDAVTGSQAEVFRHYGMTAEGLAETARALAGKTKGAA